MSHNSPNDHTAVMDAIRFYAISQTVLLALIVASFPLEVWGMVEYLMTNLMKRKSGNRFRLAYREMARLHLFLYLNGACTVTEAILLFMGSILTEVSQELCDSLAKAFALVYLLAVTFAYLFLLQRVRMVCRFSQDKLFNTILWLTSGTLYFAIGAFLILLGIIVNGKTTLEGRCMQLVPPWLAWLFMACNFFLSLVLTYLFVSPLRRVANTGISATQHVLRMSYRRNMVISLFAVAFTTVTVATYGVLAYFAELEEKDAFHIYSMALICWDSFVLAACCRLIALFWLPKRVRNCGLHRHQQRSFQFTSPANDNVVEMQAT